MISSLYKKHSITFFYLMLLLVFSHSFISAQTPDMPFNIYLKQASLKEFTAKIEQLSEYSFIYGEEVVLKHPITLDLKETPLTTILQTAFIKQDISFEITKHHIILKKTTSLPIKQHFTLNGYVLDEISKETLIGANIYDQQNKQGTITNKRASGDKSYPCRIKSETYGTDGRTAAKSTGTPVASSLVKQTAFRQKE